MFHAFCGDTTGPGGTDVPCDCGSTVTTNTKLGSGDTICGATCPDDGLIVGPEVTELDMADCAISGSDTAVGIDASGSSDLYLKGGFVAGFGTGILADDATGARIENVHVSGQVGAGISATGTNNSIRINQVSGNGPGIVSEGAGALIETNSVRSNDGNGITASGDEVRVLGNSAQSNTGAGIVFTGNGGTVSRNSAVRNGGDGITVDGTGNTVSTNSAQGNGGDGLTILQTGNTLSGNSAVLNGGNGIYAPAGNTDAAKNLGANNTGAIQCEIAGAPCK